ncbi:zinc finger protein 845-like [Strongylocentrotus purpuratus]|uniref:C2H2-type domain-containing protein n=1 Tax=Strongylocentrotus purpuratus TaxID=7668 RepID=A0A7M7NA26_STRPU|nr:zinc finger protein 845-like [Strongylocentrotus purpuratus]
MSLPTGRSNVCSTCGKCFKRLAALENHKRLSHPKDEHLIKASCQQRMIPAKKTDGKTHKKKIHKKTEVSLKERVISNHDLSCQQGPESKSSILLQQGVSGEVGLARPDAAIGMSRQGREGQYAGFETRLDRPGSSNGFEDHQPLPETSSSSMIDGNQSIYQARLPKHLNITKNVTNGTYSCTDCKACVYSVDFLFSHDCNETVNRDSPESPCKDCGLNARVCSCRKLEFQLVVREKDPCCSICGRVFSDEMAKKQHKCLQTDSWKSVRPVGGHFGNDVTNEARSDASIGLADAQNKNVLKPRNDNAKCPYCKKMFRNDLYLNNHMLSHSELQKFDCFYCRQLFPTGAALKEHLGTVHVQRPEETLQGQEAAGVVYTDSGLRWKCSLCPKIFSCKSNRRRHQMWHFGIRPHACELCGAAFRQRWQLQAHKKTKRCQNNRNRTKNVLLRLSDAPIKHPHTADSSNQMVLNGELEEGEVTENLASDSVKDIYQRISNSQPLVSPTPASQAPIPEFAAIPTSSLSSSVSHNPMSTKCLDQPMLEHVPEEEPLDLTRLTGLDMETNDTRSFICQECGKLCKTNRNLMIHKRIHTGERPYNCSLCSLTFRQSHHRKAHMLSKHGVYHPVPKANAKKEIVVMTEEGIRYKCHYCSKVLMSRSGRRKHERWHLGLRPHKCDNCGNMFKQLQHLKKHQMSSKCRVSQIKLIDTKNKRNYNDSSNPRIGPLTSWHMMQVLAENHRKKKALAASDISALSSESEAPQVTDVRSAVGLISTEELKAKERAKKLAEDASEKSRDNDEDENVVGQCLEEIGNITDEGDKAETVGRYALENDEESINGISIKEEVFSEIEDGEIVDGNDHMSYQNGEVNGNFQECKDFEAGGGNDLPLNLTNANSLGDVYEDLEAYQAQCHICGQYYKTRQNLSIHMRIHTGERPHSCSICSKKFIQPHHLKAHLKSKHDIVMVTPSRPIRQEEIIMTQEGIRFKCQFCPKLLSSKNGRQKHERWHLGLRPHKCDVCGKAFKQSHHLKRHKVGTACIPLDKQPIKEECPSPPPSPPPSEPLLNVPLNPSAPLTVLLPVTIRAAPAPVHTDLTVKEALPGQLPSEGAPTNIETAREVPLQIHPPPEATKDMTPQDLSMPSSKLIDLHCYE